MYFVKYGDEYLHDPRTNNYILLDLSIEGEANTCGFCDFTIYPNHPMYDKLKERDADNQIMVYDGSISEENLLFAGFIYELGKEFYLDGHVRCKGELSYLSESIVRPYSTYLPGHDTAAPETPTLYFEWLIEQHNSQVNPNKRFVVGLNQVSHLDSSNLIFRDNSKYPNTFDEINNQLIEQLGGYIRVRHEDGVRYIDYISEFTDENYQILDFGVNLTDYTQTDDSSNLATCIVPLGARLRDTEYEYDDGYRRTADKVPDKNKTYYTLNEDGGYSQCSDLTTFEAGVVYYEHLDEYDQSDDSLTLKFMNDGGYGVDDFLKVGDYIYCISAFNKYGPIYTTFEDQDITTAPDLFIRGIAALKEFISPKRTIEIKAVDMHLINPSLKSIRMGEFVRVRSRPHKFDSYMLCVKIDLDLNSPEQSIYTLGTTYDTLTGEQNARIKTLNAETNKAIDSVVASNEAIKQTATTASSSAKKAQEEATMAKEAANAATVTSTSALTSAQQASSAASQAQASATQATTAANEAKSKSEEAIEEAGNVRTELSGQIQTLINTMTADYSKKSDVEMVESTLRSEISQSATDISTSVEQTYYKKTEAETLETTLRSEISQSAEAITTRVETAEGDISTLRQTTEGFEARIAKTEGRSVGGVNLYSGTRNFEGTRWNNLEYWEYLDTEGPFKEYGRWGAWQGISQAVKVVAGGEYTFSFDGCSDGNANVHVYTNWDGVGVDTTPSDFELGVLTDDIYTRYSVTFTANESGYVYPRVENAEESWLQVCALKFERGNTATDWSPAPEDAENGIAEAGKTATKYLGFSEDGLVVGDLEAETLGNNVLIDSDSVDIRDGEDVLASFSPNGVEFKKKATFTADGILIDNGDAYATLGKNQILFSHENGYYMNATQTVNLADNISRQMSGAVFAWCQFDPNTGKTMNQDWHYFFVPKSHVTNNSGDAVRMSDPYSGINKYIYISNGNITGHYDNGTSGTTNGIAWNNKIYTLRYVIGV